MAVVEISSTESTTKTDESSSVTVERAQGRKSLAGIIYRPPIDAQPGHYKNSPPSGPLESRIIRSVGSDFKKKSTNAVLEVLLDEPRVSIRSRLRKSSQIACNSSDQDDGMRDSQIIRQSAKRIRIRSPKLFKFFASIPASVGNSFNMPGTTSVVRCPTIYSLLFLVLRSDYHIDQVFLYPFKLFIVLEPYIRRQFLELEHEDQERRKNETHSLEGRKDSPKSGIKFRPVFDQQSSFERIVTDDEETLRHLRLLIEVFDTDLKHLLETRRQIQERRCTTIAYADLWLLFEYGQDIITPGSKVQVYRVLRWTGGREILAKHGLYSELQARAIVDAQSVQRADVRNSAFVVECINFEFDGEQYGPMQKTFSIRKYDGKKPITSLSVYPLAFAQDSELIRKRLTERGNLYLQLSRFNEGSHKHYSGLTLDEPHEQGNTREAVFRTYTGLSPIGIGNLTEHNLRETYEETVNPTVTNGICSEDDCCDNENVHKDYDWDMQREEQFFDEHKIILAPTTDPNDIEDEEKILLPPFVYGFALRNRKWAMFDIDLIRDVDYSSGFEDLVLPPGHKETVRALVANHSRVPGPRNGVEQEDHSIDLVKGKGTGLVILLHGAPGVGKTSTAECVADSTKRPLFPITCGDIGDTASEVETNLEKNFQLAHKWGCVLLLDEADIFLQKRDKTDMKRNSVVSVFLRTMEYYSGILFLTTNRVGIFDQAFRSRIHISLYYPGLQKEATLQIWKMHLVRTQRSKNEHFKIRTKEILKFAKTHYIELKKANAGSWNGRQIRNAVQTAIALAEFEASQQGTIDKNGSQVYNVELSERHFATVAKASRDFDKYLRSALGGQTDADVARLEQTRVDDFHKLVESMKLEQRTRDKGKRKPRIEFDSEDSAPLDSEDSDDDSESKSSNGESSEADQIPVKLVKSNQETKNKKSRK
ncbi:uncharacterized protein KY384_008253 [Bacidia gigantensis]|uniref:uncharacterized protein n=1 Tax=Bacidia gigantensis TaxID=2732470 RepID=UPI001D049318|nr:uncharacterized protein KY384_008253 [Bacidia gigantensis]KAG8526824.1 hypothetical protein KY384_008253 [Bacidia gigantensis]